MVGGSLDSMPLSFGFQRSYCSSIAATYFGPPLVKKFGCSNMVLYGNRGIMQGTQSGRTPIFLHIVFNAASITNFSDTDHAQVAVMANAFAPGFGVTMLSSPAGSPMTATGGSTILATTTGESPTLVMNSSKHSMVRKDASG